MAGSMPPFLGWVICLCFIVSCCHGYYPPWCRNGRWIFNGTVLKCQLYPTARPPDRLMINGSCFTEIAGFKVFNFRQIMTTESWQRRKALAENSDGIESQKKSHMIYGYIAWLIATVPTVALLVTVVVVAMVTEYRRSRKTQKTIQFLYSGTHARISDPTEADSTEMRISMEPRYVQDPTVHPSARL